VLLHKELGLVLSQIYNKGMFEKVTTWRTSWKLAKRRVTWTTVTRHKCQPAVSVLSIISHITLTRLTLKHARKIESGQHGHVWRVGDI
jgi:hypothetical protein